MVVQVDYRVKEIEFWDKVVDIVDNYFVGGTGDFMPWVIVPGAAEALCFGRHWNDKFHSAYGNRFTGARLLQANRPETFRGVTFYNPVIVARYDSMGEEDRSALDAIVPTAMDPIQKSLPYIRISSDGNPA